MGCCTAASFGLTAALGRLNLIHAFACGAATAYKALVCIFLFGGNDGNNLIVPNDNAGYQNYAEITSLQPVFPTTSIGSQFKQVAQITIGSWFARPDFLLRARGLRYAQRPTACPANTLFAARSGLDRILQFHGRAGSSAAGYVVHSFGF